MWVWLVLLYGILKGAREVCKKKALETSTSIEVLLVYTMVSFFLVCPDAPNAMGMETKYYFLVLLKSFIIFLAWILSFLAIKKLPLSMYGVLDLSRVLFSTLLGVVVLHERLSYIHIVGLVLVCTGLTLLKFKPVFEKSGSNESNIKGYQLSIVIVAIISCMLNSLSGLMDKILMKDITSSQLQFWYMLFLCLFYIAYAMICKKRSASKEHSKTSGFGFWQLCS